MSESSKKRKRQSDGSQLASKTPAAGPRQIRIHIDNDAGLPPALLSTAGLTTPSVAFDPYTKKRSHGAEVRDSYSPDTYDFLLHSSKHPRLDYLASPGHLDRSLSHYVGVFDPVTHQLRLSPAYKLDLRISLRTAPKDEAQQKRTFGQQREDLNAAFGTKKAKKGLAARTLNAIGNSTPSKAGVQEAILESMGDSATPALSEREQLEAALASKPIPKPFLDAKEVSEVYPLDVLVPPSDAPYVTIKEWQQSARDGEELELSHRFPAWRLEAVGKSGNVQRLKALKYLYLLLQFHDALTPAGKTGKKVPKKESLQKKLSIWPEPLVDSVRRRFANPHNELSKWHMDNLYTHMCALSLYADGWTTDITNLRDDLRMRENKELVPYFRELGCKIAAPTEKERETLNKVPLTKAQGAVTKVAKLKLPLEFPKAGSGRRR